MTTTPTPAGPGVTVVAASEAQQGLWYLSALWPESTAYQQVQAYIVDGEVDVAALRASWRAILARHELLRATFADERGVPVLRIPAAAIEDRSFVEAGTPGLPVPALVARLAGTPLPPDTGPLARLTLVRLAPRRYLIVLAAHRLVADDLSMAILVEEVSSGYAAALAGSASRAALAPRRRYADFATAQRSLAGTPRLAEMLQWWVATHTPPAPPLELPSDRARPPGPAHRGGVVGFDWGPESGRLLADACRARRCTPFAVLLAGYQALLARYAGQPRVAVGTPVSVRPAAQFERVVGAFENMLVLPADATGTFGEFLDRVERTVRDGYARRDVPFHRVVRALRPARDPRRPPLYDAVFALAGGAERDLRLAGAVVTRVPAHHGGAGADLSLRVHRTVPAVAGQAEYRAEMFDAASAGRMLAQLRTLLLAALRDPDRPVAELPLEPVAQTRARVRACDRIAAAAPVRRGVPELVRRWVRDRPDAVAVAGPGQALSYRMLGERAARIAAALGAVAGRPVAVRATSGPDQVAALLGVLEAGAHLVCLGSGEVGERGRAVLADARPAALVTDGGDGELARWYRRTLGGPVVDAGCPPRAPARAPATVELTVPASVEPDALAYLAYTSGSTGRPKGITQSHATLAQFVTWFAGSFGVGTGSRVAQWAAPGYDASLCEIFAALVAGATVCPVPERIRAHPGRVADWLAAERITLFQTVPSFAREVLAALLTRGAGDRPGTLDHLLLAGEALAGDLANQLRAALPGTRLVNLYGATESILATWYEVTGPVSGTAPVGQPIPGRQVLVLDAKDRHCPPGVTGEIVVRSPYLTAGYLGADPAREPAFRRVPGLTGHRVYRTGDLGRWRFDGQLEFRGRRDEQVKYHGTRLELAEVETALAGHATVAECAVLPVTGADGLVTGVCAYVVPRAGAGPGLIRVWRAALWQRFGAGLPSVSFTILPDLPRNLGGKVDRRRLARRTPEAVPAAAPAATAVGRALAEIWARLPGVAATGPEDSFFAAGGHSLLVPGLLARVREAFGVEVAVGEFVAHPTRADLAALIEARRGPVLNR